MCNRHKLKQKGVRGREGTVRKDLMARKGRKGLTARRASYNVHNWRMTTTENT